MLSATKTHDATELGIAIGNEQLAAISAERRARNIAKEVDGLLGGEGAGIEDVDEVGGLGGDEDGAGGGAERREAQRARAVQQRGHRRQRLPRARVRHVDAVVLRRPRHVDAVVRPRAREGVGLVRWDAHDVAPAVGVADVRGCEVAHYQAEAPVWGSSGAVDDFLEDLM